ncbi:MAG: CPBP family intramembrane metalloprotease [Anaerolineae bacterium]|nr:CPBP family intramembrane metalloprotease [Anaerolineae bacterium]
MNEPITVSVHTSATISENRFVLYAAWTLVLLLTVPQIILGAFLHLDIGWLEPARLIILASLFALSFVWSLIRPLRRLILAFLIIYGVEGWLLGSLFQGSQLFASVFGGNMNLTFFGERLARIGATLVMLFALLGMGLKRQEFFLTIGKLNAVTEAERWGIPRRPQTWPGFGGRYALIIVTIFVAFMVPSLHPSLSNLSVGLVAFAALCALMNAFAEEFLYRSALLPQVLPIFGKDASLILVASWFGIGHYFGVPYGITGVILTTFGGWIFAKSMVETRGMGWPLFLHFVSDFTVYLIILLAGGF